MHFDERVLRRLKLSDLRLFHAVVQRGGMAKAAAHLNISQPAVSKAVAALEHTLKVRLLDRNPHGVELTIYGRALLEGGAAVFDDLRQTMKQMAFLADPHEGELHIGSTELGAVALVPAIIDRLSRQYPRVVFHVITTDTATLTERALPERTIELAIGAMPDVLKNDQIESESLFLDRQVIMGGRRSKWVRRHNVALAELLDEPWILPSPDSIAGRYVAEAFHANGLEPPRARVISFSIPLCHSLVAAGRFLTLQPVLMARLVGHLPLRQLDVQFSGVLRSIGLMTLRRRTLSPLAQVFIDCAREVTKLVGKARR
jgi:DNA-binding transcriptional LysR family regulator